MDEETVAFVGISLGALATVVGVFMWQGGWAALAALGLLVALFATGQWASTRVIEGRATSAS
jgi:hypothetical protein